MHAGSFTSIFEDSVTPYNDIKLTSNQKGCAENVLKKILTD